MDSKILLNQVLFILLIVFLRVSCVFAQNANKLYLNLDPTYESKQVIYNFLKYTNDRYYVIFSVHDRQVSDNPEANSAAGHAWVVWAHENPQFLTSEVSGYGFWPDYEKIENDINVTRKQAEFIAGGTIIGTVLSNASVPNRLFNTFLKSNDQTFAGVPGELTKDLFMTKYSSSIKQVVVEVDKATYYQSFNVINEYKNYAPDYKLLENDCVSFFIEVGKSIGFDMPDRSLLSPNSYFPKSYMDLFINTITSPSKIDLHYQNKSMVVNNYGTATASSSGEYNVTFGFERENKNSCELDFSGNRVENFYRDNILKCSKINYPNGEFWYQEYEGKPIPPEHAKITGVVRGKPISEYWFTNGNYIIGYGQNPEGFNPNYVSMNLSEKNTQYSGTINNLGEPNGLGTLSHFGNILNGQFQNNIKTGKFIDGKFIEHTGVSFEKALVYGDFINGQLNGKGRIEYNDNKVFTGTFDKGLANGNCSFVDNNTGEYYSGTFKDGYMNGLGIHKNQSGLYKGNFINGKACGSGVAQTPNGNICEGSFENGGFKNGKLTTANGNYYIGNFDTKGNPTNGKYYDKNGKEITENETHGNERDKDLNGKIVAGWQVGDGPFVEDNWGWFDINGK